MKLQELIEETDLPMNETHVKAFFLGAMSAEKPLSFPQTLGELLADNPECKITLEPELKKLWSSLQEKKAKELAQFFTENSDPKEYLNQATQQLDFFLTALSLAGTTVDSSDGERAEMIDELEEIIMEIDDFLAGEDKDPEELKEALIEVWQDFLDVI